jgi:membrane-anchored mycosin MYCP
MTNLMWVTMAAGERNHYVAYVRFRIADLSIHGGGGMRRLAVAVLGLALVAAVQAPATAAIGSATVPNSPAKPKASPKPSPKPSPSKSGKPSPKPTRHPTGPTLPTQTTVLPRPTSNCPAPPAQAPSARVTTVPWAQQALDFSSVWPLTEGQGVTVAVVDSGVDYTPQLAGRVTDYDVTGTGVQDCVGHGTAVASIIAASDQQVRGEPFAGVAPAAKIISVKVNSQSTGTSAILAQGIRDAASLGAEVISVSIVTRNTPELAAAVAFALHKGAVIVAAGGNDDPQDGIGPFYPASYPGVLSVGAVASDGSLGDFSDQRSDVAVTAPGVNVTGAYPGGGYQVNDLTGTSFATPFVSGLAALIRARYPRLSGPAVVARIEDTADGGSGPGTGDGLINPVQAVTAILPPGGPPSGSPSAPHDAISVLKAPPPDPAAHAIALEITLGSLGAAAVVALGAVLIGQGRRRRWQAGRAEVPAAEPEPPSAAQGRAASDRVS